MADKILILRIYLTCITHKKYKWLFSLILSAKLIIKCKGIKMALPDELYFLFLFPNGGPNHIMVSLALSFVTPKYLT